MRGVICAVAVGHLPVTGLIVDPSEEECTMMDAGGCFAFIFAEGVGNHAESVWTSWRSKSGGFAEKDFTEARMLAKNAAQHVCNAMKASIPWMGTAESFELASSAGIKGPDREEGDDEKMEIWYVNAHHSRLISFEPCITLELEYHYRPNVLDSDRLASELRQLVRLTSGRLISSPLNTNLSFISDGSNHLSIFPASLT